MWFPFPSDPNQQMDAIFCGWTSITVEKANQIVRHSCSENSSKKTQPFPTGNGKEGEEQKM